jgi:hypothetical protein
MNLKTVVEINRRLDLLEKKVELLQKQQLHVEDVVAPKTIKVKRGPGRPRKEVANGQV